MPYCQKCGARLEDDAKYCASCGTPVHVSETRVRKERRGSSALKILLLIIGGIFLLVAFGLLVGGGALLWLNTSLTDSGGFITTRSSRLATDSYAIVFQHINIEWGESIAEWRLWRPALSDFVTIKIAGSTNDPSRDIFIGIAREPDASLHLSNVDYDEVTRFDVSTSGLVAVEYSRHIGRAAPSSPTSETFWVASKHGSGTQTLEWSPEAGNYWIVLMNEDGSASVDLTVVAGAKVPLLSTIGLALFAGGVVALVIGVFMIYFGVRRL